MTFFPCVLPSQIITPDANVGATQVRKALKKRPYLSRTCLARGCRNQMSLTGEAIGAEKTC